MKTTAQRMLLMPAKTNRPPTRSARTGPIVHASGVVSDWLESLSDADLDHESLTRLQEWSSYLAGAGAPPTPLPLEPTPAQVEQALRAFMRNVYRAARLSSEARFHELRQTVAELVATNAAQSRRISGVRDRVHSLLHAVEDADPESKVVADTTAAVRKELRELDNEAKKSRSSVNERLQEMRLAILARVVTTSDIIPTEHQREIHFRSLCAAAGLFGENVTVVSIVVEGDTGEVATVAQAARSVFRRETDVVSKTGNEVCVILVDTPEKHVFRLLAEVGATLGADLPSRCTASVSTEAEQAGSVETAIAIGTRQGLHEVLPK